MVLLGAVIIVGVIIMVASTEGVPNSAIKAANKGDHVTSSFSAGYDNQSASNGHQLLNISFSMLEQNFLKIDSHHRTVYELTRKEIKHPHYRYRWDDRCGLKYKLHNGLHGQCDPHGKKPCCSPQGLCGGTNEHCQHGGIDYRGNCGPHLGLWLCADGACIFIENVCNGKEDCLDGSDEPITCPVHCSVGEFSCGPEEEKRCIPRSKLCDGVWDCVNGEDELRTDCSSHHNDWDEH